MCSHETTSHRSRSDSICCKNVPPRRFKSKLPSHGAFEWIDRLLFFPSQCQQTVLSCSFYSMSALLSQVPTITVLKGNKSSRADEPKGKRTISPSWRHFRPFSSRLVHGEIWELTFGCAADVFIICVCTVNRNCVSVFSSVLESCCSFIKCFIIPD